MGLLDTLATGLRSLCVHKLRSLLTVLGVIIGVAAVVCMMSVGAGARDEVSETIRTLGANLLIVWPGAGTSRGARLERGTRHTLTQADAAAIRHQLSYVQVAAPLVSRQMQLIAGNNNWSTLVAGIDNDYLLAREWSVSQGRAFTSDELSAGAKVAIVGSTIVDELFPEASGIGQSFRIGKVPFVVVGVLEPKGQGAAGRSQDDVVFIPLETAKSRVVGAVRGTRRDAMELILVKTSEQEAVGQVKSAITTLLRERHQLRPDAADDFNIENPAEVLAARDEAVRTVSYLLISVAAVSLIVGGISIMNVMLVSITERTREIGLRIAVGAQRYDIRRQFLFEAVALAIVGGIFGVALGCVGAQIIAWQTGWRVLISPDAIILSCVFAGAVGLLFGLYPAYRASRLDPIVALRYE